MKPLIEEIQDILTPNKNVGMVKEGRIYQLQPLLPVSQLFELAEDLDPEGQEKILKFLLDQNTVVFSGIVYISSRGLNLKGRLKEILSIYNSHIRQIVGDKKALISLYETIPAEDIANLTQDHVIFVMKKIQKSGKRSLAAIRYLPDYDIHFEKNTFHMPGCIIAINIDSNFLLDHPEVIVDNRNYQHPFVYRDQYKLGQKICLGSFYSSTERTQFNKLRFANNVNNLIKQSVQILISGYNRRVTPANGHLYGQQYKKFIVS
jgi:hypothetical protein